MEKEKSTVEVSIRGIQNQDIDRIKWNECIKRDKSGLIYGNSWYLDIVCPGWHALVEGDYDSVFPLPVKRKFGISYIFHPLFTQQLGLFIKNERAYTTQDFINSIPTKFMKVNLRLKADSTGLTGPQFSKRLNHILTIPEIDLLQKGFNQNTKRNIKRGKMEGIEIRNELSIDDFVSFKMKTSKAELSNAEWDRMKNLIQTLSNKKHGSFITAYKGDELISAIFFTKWNGRITYLFSSNSSLGKDLRAGFLLVNEILSDNAGSGNIMDFEGSMDDNIARFFKGFGAKEEVYFEFQKGISY